MGTKIEPSLRLRLEQVFQQKIDAAGKHVSIDNLRGEISPFHRNLRKFETVEEMVGYANGFIEATKMNYKGITLDMQEAMKTVVNGCVDEACKQTGIQLKPATARS